MFCSEIDVEPRDIFGFSHTSRLRSYTFFIEDGVSLCPKGRTRSSTFSQSSVETYFVENAGSEEGDSRQDDHVNEGLRGRPFYFGRWWKLLVDVSFERLSLPFSSVD